VEVNHSGLPFAQSWLFQLTTVIPPEFLTRSQFCARPRIVLLSYLGLIFSVNFVLCDDRLRNGSREISVIALEFTVKISQLCQLVTDYC